MKERERHLLCELTGELERVLRGDFTSGRTSITATPELAPLAGLVERLSVSLREAQDFISALSQGRLEIDPPTRNHLVAPFKQLQANLRHLTWQTQQIAAGDLNQQVDFMGEFSVAFNRLIEALREKRLAEDRLRYVSNHDPLTDLYNRGYFAEEMERMERGRRFPVSIIMADLDGLKRVNDTLGHAAGDRLIQEAARIIRCSVRGDDVVARMGGDEFAVILPNTGTEAAGRVLSRLRENERTFHPADSGYFIGISIGIATAHLGESLQDTLKQADQRMYEDKAARKQMAAHAAKGTSD
jgi:diguanylate cyclase (GGDEF)-like protein